VWLESKFDLIIVNINNPDHKTEVCAQSDVCRFNVHAITTVIITTQK